MAALVLSLNHRHVPTSAVLREGMRLPQIRAPARPPPAMLAAHSVKTVSAIVTLGPQVATAPAAERRGPSSDGGNGERCRGEEAAEAPQKRRGAVVKRTRPVRAPPKPAEHLEKRHPATCRWFAGSKICLKAPMAPPYNAL